MITVTRLDGSPLLVSVDQIQQVEQTPDTLLTLVNGETLMVREAPHELVERVVEFKRAVAGSTTASLAIVARARAALGEAGQ